MPRKKGYRTPDEIREKIQGSQIINRLQTHVMADTEVMTASQVNAAKVLLGKIIPDLKSTDLDVTTKGETLNGVAVRFVDGADS